MPSTRSKNKHRHSWQFEAIGTEWVIETRVALSGKTRRAVLEHIGEFDRTYSRFREDSLVSRIAGKPGQYEFPAEGVELVDLYRKMYDVTDGAVTPLVGNVLESLGYDKDYSFIKSAEQMVERWDDVMRWSGGKLTTKNKLMLDFGAIGKGLLVDEVAAIVELHDHHDYVIDASGDIRHKGADVQAIGLENPYDPTAVIGVVNVQNKSLCASAVNRRSWGEGIHHVIDGRTGKPTNDIVATWVIAESTALADGLATALFFVSEKELYDFSPFSYVRLSKDNRIEHSRNFVGELFV